MQRAGLAVAWVAVCGVVRASRHNAIPDGVLDSFGASNDLPSITSVKNSWDQRVRAYLTVLATAVAADLAKNGQQSTNRVPLYLTLQTDQASTYECPISANPVRERNYLVRDSLGRPWVYTGYPKTTTYPLQISEAFTQVGGNNLPEANLNGPWTTQTTGNYQSLGDQKGLLDTYGSAPAPDLVFFCSNITQLTSTRPAACFRHSSQDSPLTPFP